MASLKKLKKDLTKLSSEDLKDVLEFLVDDEEEDKKVEPQPDEKKEEPKKEETKTEQPKTKVETKKEIDFEAMFKSLQDDFDKKLKVVVEEVKKTKDEQKEKFGVKAQPKEKKDGDEFEDLFNKLRTQAGQ